MKNTKKTNTLCSKTRQIAMKRLAYLKSLLSGEKGLSGPTRLRSYRIENSLSIRSAFRLEAFLSDIVTNQRISRTAYNRLSDEIPEFEQVLSTPLVNRIEAIIA